MPDVDPNRRALSRLQFPISTRSRQLRHARIVATAIALLLLAGLTIASGQNKKVTIDPQRLHPIYLPDLAIKNGSIRVNPAYTDASAKHTPELFATMIVANVGRGRADFRRHKIYAQVGEPATAVYCWCSKRQAMPVPTLAPGASFTLKLAIYHDPHGEYECGPHQFEFAVDQDIDPSQHWGHRMNEVTDANNSFGPVYLTIPKDLCQPPRLKQQSSQVSGVAQTRAHGAQAKKLAPASQAVRPGHPSPTKSATLNKRTVTHKIGLAPWTLHTMSSLPAVQLPPGWSAAGGVLHASRPGLRLRLSGGHTLVSKLGTAGRLGYELLDASGRVVKRITAKESMHISVTGALLLERTRGPHRQVLLGRVLKTVRP